MTRILRTSRTERDLMDIWAHIAQDNPDAADRQLREIARVEGIVAANPKAGRQRPELARGLRSFAVGNYVVFYQEVPGGILVVRVLHGARDIPEYL